MEKFVLGLLIGGVLSDVYFHNPRGSNNRLNGNKNNRKNANRLFDSQNNNGGGYNVGDLTASEHKDKPERQYSMQYYASGPGGASDATKLLIEWTNQHGCGGNDKVHCNLVFQYMCMNNGTHEDYPTTSKSAENLESRYLYMRDGVDTDTPAYTEPSKKESDSSYTKRMLKNQASDDEDGLHESVYWYDQCRYREANGGLFLADQRLKADKVGYNTASRTRQNRAGGRSGYECPEERDYFPYWAPTYQTENLNSRFQRTPWIDVAWLGDTSKCNWIKANSFNRNKKYRCVLNGQRKYGRSIDAGSCKKEGGKWVEFNSFLEVLEDITSSSACAAAAKADSRNKISWMKLRSDDAKSRCVVQAPEITCNAGPISRVNHLGNTGNSNNASRLIMDMPYFPSGQSKRCVMRVRYNITTGDYDPWKTDKSSNKKDDVIENDPQVDVLGNGEKLTLAINTAQTGRVFQDRSHAYIVLPRTAKMAGKVIQNLNVRGRRGNLVQTIPAVEYDFVPDRLVMGTNELLHIQWTGSNSNDKNNNGEGSAGTDRHNLMQMSSLAASYPNKISEADFWNNVESLTDPDASGKDIAIGLASSGYYCAEKATGACPKANTLKQNSKSSISGTLDNVPASFFGHVLKFKKAGSMKYMCTRNNSFSNRSQKGVLYVSDNASSASSGGSSKKGRRGRKNRGQMAEE